MRRKVWCCLVGGLLGSGLSVGLSQERAPTSEWARSAAEAPAATSAYRRARTSAPTTERRSYYSELFGQDVATPLAEATPAVEPETAPDAPAEQRAPRGTFTISGRPTPTPPAQPTASDIIHAEFERPADESERTRIQQVGASAFGMQPVDPRPARSALTQPVLTPGAPPMPPSVSGNDRAAPSAPLPPAPTPTAAAPATTAATANVTRTAVPRPQAKPSSGPQESCVQVEWVKDGEMNLGRECACDLVVTNTGDSPVRSIEVSALLSRNVKLVSAEPQPESSDELLAWYLPELAAGGTQTIHITLLPLAPGAITTQAEVRFSTAAAGQFEVAEPMLALQLDGPQQVLIGEAATQTILVSNPGTGVAANVRIEALIPTGLEHARGAELLMDLGPLHPGETRSIRLPLAAIAGGTHTVQVMAQAESDLEQQATADVTVIAPQVATAIDGPSLRYIGRRATYTIQVQNDGSVATDNVRVMHKVPAGLTFISAADGGQYDEGSRLLTWFVDRLEQGQQQQLTATFSCDEMGAFTHFVRATSAHGSVSDARFTTNVEGASSLALDIQDLEDPVEIGIETAYEIRVSNEGSAPAKNVAVSCELPAGLTLVNVESQIPFATERNLIAFQPIAQVRPGETVTIRVQVKAAAEGNHRFRTRLSSESIDEPIVGDELTRFYGE